MNVVQWVGAALVAAGVLSLAAVAVVCCVSNANDGRQFRDTQPRPATAFDAHVNAALAVVTETTIEDEYGALCESERGR